jgi:serine/threonine protein phosphatase 1
MSSVPDGVRVYAIGDVHGCREQMVSLLSTIGHHREGFAGIAHLVFLGDIVDRGPDSSGVIEHLMHAELPADRLTFIMGNHEEMMLDCCDGQSARYEPWLRYGGVATMASYGVTQRDMLTGKFDLGSAMKSNVPPDHIAFLRSFEDTFTIGDYLFVHAGIRPGTKLERQATKDLRWISSEFLNSKADHGFTVVHGHTINPEIVIRKNRIGVDTGCYNSGILSSLVLEGTNVSSLSTA